MTRVAGARGGDTDDATTSRGFCVLTPADGQRHHQSFTEAGDAQFNENLLQVAQGVSPSQRIWRVLGFAGLVLLECQPCSYHTFLLRHRSHAFETDLRLGAQSCTAAGEKRAGLSPAGSEAIQVSMASTLLEELSSY